MSNIKTTENGKSVELELDFPQRTELRSAHKNEEWYRFGWIVYDAIISALATRGEQPNAPRLEVKAESISADDLEAAHNAAVDDYATLWHSANVKLIESLEAQLEEVKARV